MPTNVSGSQTAAESPSPAPGPGIVPIAQVPVDGDPRNAASVTQPMKLSADYLAYLQATARWRPPRTASSQVGFTSVTHTGAGAGSISPANISSSLSQPTNSPYNFVFKIVVGGAIGTATFQVSLDGGTTYGGTVTTAASYTEPTSGITVLMSGTMTAADTYAFSACDVPMAGFVDSGGNNHGLVVDHLGFPVGPRTEFREDWVGLGSQFIALNNQTTQPMGPGNRWIGTTGASGTMSYNPPDTAYPNTYLTLLTGATSGSRCAMSTNGQIAPATINANGVYVIQFDVGVSAIGTTNLAFFAGLSTTTTPTSTGNCWGVAYYSSSTTAGWFVATGAFSLASINVPTVAVSEPNYRVRIEYGGASSVLAGFARLFVNEQLVAASTPAAFGASLYLTFDALAKAPSPTAVPYVGAVYAGWNRWANPGLL